MEKTLNIGEKKVRFATSGIACFIYNKQTHRDLLVDIYKLMDPKIGGVNLDGVDTCALLEICWTFARVADRTIPEPMEWLDSFEAFPVYDILPDISELLLACLTTKEQPKNGGAAAVQMIGRNHLAQR